MGCLLHLNVFGMFTPYEPLCDATLKQIYTKVLIFFSLNLKVILVIILL